MLVVVGPQCGRMQKRGSDPWGRFTWTEMRGGMDEGREMGDLALTGQGKGIGSTRPVHDPLSDPLSLPT